MKPKAVSAKAGISKPAFASVSLAVGDVMAW